MLKAAVTKYCAEILATKKKTTAAAYARTTDFREFLYSGFRKNEIAHCTMKDISFADPMLNEFPIACESEH
jgi:hypothetical protein